MTTRLKEYKDKYYLRYKFGGINLGSAKTKKQAIKLRKSYTSKNKFYKGKIKISRFPYKKKKR